MQNINLILTILLYALANLALWGVIRFAFSPGWCWRLPAAGALFLHAILLYQWIDHGHVQDLALPNIISMTIWFAGVLILLIGFAQPVQNLTFLIFPLAILTILLHTLGFVADWLDTQTNPYLLTHILLSILVLSIWWIAFAQALLLSMQNYLLRKQASLYWLGFLPTLESMENLLFQCISLGFILLTFNFISTFWLAQQNHWSYMLSKVLFSGLAWIVYGLLLIGRYLYHWHGTRAIKGTLIGFIFLLAAYIGSQVLL